MIVTIRPQAARPQSEEAKRAGERKGGFVLSITNESVVFGFDCLGPPLRLLYFF